MALVDFAAKCVAHMQELVETGPLVKQKTFWVYTEEDLLREMNLIKAPGVGIIYEGTRNRGLQQHGRASEVGVALAVIMEGSQIATLDRKEAIVDLLDQLRIAIMGKTSPTGHPWAFQLETPTGDIVKNLLFLQRWSTAIIL